MIQKEGGSDLSQTQLREQNITESLNKKRMISLYIEPTSICNLTCKFCDLHYNPKSHFKPTGSMSMDTYYKIIHQLNELHFRYKTINFFLHGESLLNANLIKMIQIARKEKISSNFTLTTNGILMTPDKFDQLVNAGITTILVSLDSVNRQYFKDFKGADKLDIILHNIDYALHNTPLNVQFGIKCTTTEHSKYIEEDQSSRVIEYFKETVKHSNNLHVHLKNELSWPEQDKKLKNTILIPCEFPFYQTVINSDGTVTSCCADITNSLVIGDIWASSLKEIIRSKKIKDIQRSLLTGKPPQICRHCLARTAVNFKDCKDTLLNIIDS